LRGGIDIAVQMELFQGFVIQGEGFSLWFEEVRFRVGVGLKNYLWNRGLGCGSSGTNCSNTGPGGARLSCKGRRQRGANNILVIGR